MCREKVIDGVLPSGGFRDDMVDYELPLFRQFTICSLIQIASAEVTMPFGFVEGCCSHFPGKTTSVMLVLFPFFLNLAPLFMETH